MDISSTCLHVLCATWSPFWWIDASYAGFWDLSFGLSVHDLPFYILCIRLMHHLFNVFYFLNNAMIIITVHNVQAWAVLKPGFLALLEDPFNANLLDIILFDVLPHSDGNGEDRISLAKETKERNPLRYGFMVRYCDCFVKCLSKIMSNLLWKSLDILGSTLYPGSLACEWYFNLLSHKDALCMSFSPYIWWLMGVGKLFNFLCQVDKFDKHWHRHQYQLLMKGGTTFFGHRCPTRRI